MIIKNTILIAALSLTLIACTDVEINYAPEVEVSFLRINSEIKMFRVLCKRYPQNLEELNNLTTSCQKWQQREEAEKVKITDYWGRAYYYAFPKKHKGSPHGYDLHSYGEDGLANTTDDINTWMDQSIWTNYYRPKSHES